MNSLVKRYKLAVVSLPVSVVIAVLLFLLGGYHAVVIARSLIVVGIALAIFSLAKGKKNQNLPSA